MNSEFEATPMYNIDYSIAHVRARGTYFYKIKFLRLKENSYNLQKFCTLKITRCTVYCEWKLFANCRYVPVIGHLWPTAVEYVRLVHNNATLKIKINVT